MRIGELAARAGTTVRTVRYYVARGLLPPPLGGGPRSAYTYEHLVRLGAIQALKARYLPLAEIGRQLAAMTVAEMEALVVSPDEPPAGLDAVGWPLGASGAAAPRQAGGARRPAATSARDACRFQPPGTRGELVRGVAGSTLVPQAASSLWQRVVLAPGVELSFQPSGDPARDRAIAELVEEATRRLASLGAPTSPSIGGEP